MVKNIYTQRLWCVTLILRARDQGGGGYGLPAEREPERVLRDVENYVISEETARAVYGVVIRGSRLSDDLAVDLEKTQQIRSEMMAEA